MRYLVNILPCFRNIFSITFRFRDIFSCLLKTTTKFLATFFPQPNFPLNLLDLFHDLGRQVNHVACTGRGEAQRPRIWARMQTKLDAVLYAYNLVSLAVPKNDSGLTPMVGYSVCGIAKGGKQIIEHFGQTR